MDQKISKSRTKCCKNPKITERAGNYVCENCGLIVGRVILGSSPRAYSAEQIEKTKINEPVKYPGPRTLITGSKDGFGAKLDAKQRKKVELLSKTQFRETTKQEWSEQDILSDLDRIQTGLSLPESIKEDALRIYTKSKDLLLTNQKEPEVLAASVYLSLRYHETLRTMDEIEHETQISGGEILRQSQKLIRNVLPELGMTIRNLSIELYVDRIVTDLNLSMNLRNKTIEFINTAIHNGYNISGRKPKLVVAGAINFVSKKLKEPNIKGLSQKNIAENLKIGKNYIASYREELKSYIPSIK